MDSTSGGPPPEVLDEIQKLFSWNPPYLKFAEKSLTVTGNIKKSGTPTFSFYDKHFKEEAILKRVERFPTLLTQLAENVDKFLNSSTMPSTLRGFITDEQRQDDRESIRKTMRDEEAVANYYMLTTAKYCTRVASTLALHPSQWRHGLLVWDQTGPHSDYAIADGLLLFAEDENDSDEENRQVNLKEMDPETRQIFDEMRRKGDSLAIWNIKSPTAGFVDVITAVRDLGKYPWTYCDAPECLEKHDKVVDDVKVGPDALNPPWKLPLTSLDTSEETEIVPLASHSGSSMHPSHINNKGKKRDNDNDDSPAQQRPATRSATKAAYVSEFSTKGKGKKLEHEEVATRSTKPPSKRASYKNKGKKRKRDDDPDYKQKETPFETAKTLVQRVWAQAVRLDATFIVLHSGNWELVCVRDRKSQTLYISDLIEPHKYPEYGKLHVGIYIAAIQETIDRKKQLSNHPEDGNDSTGADEDSQEDKDIGGSGSRHKGGDNHHKGCNRGRGMRGSRFQGSARTLVYTDQLVEKAIDLANKYNTVLLYIRYGVYDSAIPASFFRSAPSITAHKRSLPPIPPQLEDIQLEECVTIVLTSEIGLGSIGVVHRGKLTTYDAATSLDVAVKLALDIEQRDALRNEYKVYRYLRSKGVLRGITTALGFFDDSDDSASALVTLYAGVPLSTELQGDLSVSDCKSALSTLESIHNAGILHGDIRCGNILIGDFGITIIDFSHSEHSDNRKDKEKELSQLRHFLGLAGRK